MAATPSGTIMWCGDNSTPNALSSALAPYGEFLNQLRSLEPGDIPQIVALRRRVFSQSAQESDESLARYYHALLFDNPWRDERYPSWVQEGAPGEILGFVGSIPRPMLLGVERITAVTSTELMVAPEARGLIGAKLFRRLFEGGQHLTCSDRSNDKARALYEGLGGSTALWHSLYWNASLDGRPLSFDNAVASEPRTMVKRALRRAGRVVERLAVGSTKRDDSGLTSEPLSPGTVIATMRRMAGKNTLVPEYDENSFDWLMKRVAESRSSARIVSSQIIVSGEPIGWFIYSINPLGEVDVVQLAAPPGRETAVFDHLAFQARADGGKVMRGRLDRRFAATISDRGMPLTLGQPWTVVHSTRPDVSMQFLSGNAFFSRLDSEWWITT